MIFLRKTPRWVCDPKSGQGSVLFLGLLWNITILNKEIPSSLIKINNHKKHSSAIIFHNHHHLITHQPSIFMTFHGAVESVPVRYHSRGVFPGFFGVVKSQWFVWEEGNLRQRKRCQKRDFSKKGEKVRSRDGFSLLFHWSLEISFHLFQVSNCSILLGVAIHNPMPPTVRRLNRNSGPISISHVGIQRSSRTELMRSRYGRVFLDFSSEINGEIVVNPSGLLPGPSDLYLLSLQKDSLLWSNLTSQE